ncbi:hypothetical protein [Streptomyces sp. H27-C3]|uniref:hypothetical protein n=1 Tax=Streptomyces sp. H27-C3 TaxID=3046305 RepID=UPI0024BADB1B|nr:hypothetical protein [Streptomyces sp. H27-C3]MDJ0463293.1 hypothetical protein [Streptomyces sp. H27-C3]
MTEDDNTKTTFSSAAAKVDADAAVSKAKDAAGKAMEAAESAKLSGLKGVQAGRHALESASGKVASTATTAWTVIQTRKAFVAGAGAGVVAIGAASFAAGRKLEQRNRGPITRLLAGRI